MEEQQRAVCGTERLCHTKQAEHYQSNRHTENNEYITQQQSAPMERTRETK